MKGNEKAFPLHVTLVNKGRIGLSSIFSEKENIVSTITRRIEGIKFRNKKEIQMTCDVSSYTKFDDWPPHHRQESEALTEEADALDVLKQYDYKIGDLKIHLLGNTALATFHIQYYGIIRETIFDVTSRVTILLHHRGKEWKIIHEHFSKFPPNETPSMKSTVEEYVFPNDEITLPIQDDIPVKQNELSQTIISVIETKGEIDIIDLSAEVGNRLNDYIDSSDIFRECDRLTSESILEKTGEGFYLAKFKLKN